MEEKKCLLCNKTYNYKYKMFGRGCLNNLYEQLNVSKPPRIFGNKELYLCTRIAWKNHKFFLSRNKKYEITKKYIALNYLNKIDYPILNNFKKQLSEDISNISIFSKNIVENVSFTLNDIYKCYRDSKKFDELVKEFQNINMNNLDESIAKAYIKSMSFAFDIDKKFNSISYAIYYSMQYKFWQLVVAGGVLANMKLSSILLLNSLSLFDEKPKNLIINDEEIIKQITDSKAFKNKVSFLISKYGENIDMFELNNNNNNIDTLIRFDEGDLLLALHDATMFIKAKKEKEEKWNLEIEICDTYDFTDFKNLKEYADSERSVIMDTFSTTLNNFGVVSSEYGVIKTYDLKIPFQYTFDNDLEE